MSQLQFIIAFSTPLVAFIIFFACNKLDRNKPYAEKEYIND